ncbi:glycerate kinase type-2 family protein [Poseidonocella pacifica]
MFDAAVAAADPMKVIPPLLPEKPAGRVLVVGAGKASARMAEAVESAWGPCEGYVITRYGYGRPCRGIEIVEAAHPVPDQAGVDATTHLLGLLDGVSADDFVLCLISGGGSALLCAPAGEMTLAEKQGVNSALLASGAPIGAMNVVRQHLSLVKGGQLAARTYPARMLTLLISDVPGDDPALIASGPTVGRAGTADDAREIIRRFGIELPESAQAVLDGPPLALAREDRQLSKVENRIVAAPSQSLEAAAEVARAAGLEPRILSDDLEGEARDLAHAQAAEALAVQAGMSAGQAPIVLLSGGECTVTRRGNGTGGPNAEFALAAAVALQGLPGIHVIACDTDGVDGAAEVAGAIAGPETLGLARAIDLNPEIALAQNDAHTFFEKIGAQIVPGPTLTNVNDFRAILIQPPA